MSKGSKEVQAKVLDGKQLNKKEQAILNKLLLTHMMAIVQSR